MNEWISVKERQPIKEECKQNSGWFLVSLFGYGRACLARYDGHEKECPYSHGWNSVLGERLTHWMPLPKPPEET